MAGVNPPPIQVPAPFARDPALRDYFQRLHRMLYQLWVQAGGAPGGGTGGGGGSGGGGGGGGFSGGGAASGAGGGDTSGLASAARFGAVLAALAAMEEQLEARGGGGSSDPTAGAELLAPSLLGRLAAHDQELADLAALVASRPSRACQPDDDAIALAAVSTQLHQHIGALREEVAALALLAVAHRPAPVPADLMARVEAIEAAVFP